MQLYLLFLDPKLAAECLAGAHPKWPTLLKEAAQIGSTAILSMPGFKVDPSRLYKSYPHPVCKWAARSKANLRWTVLHGIELCKIYNRNRKTPHASEKILRYLDELTADLSAASMSPVLHVGAKNPMYQSTIEHSDCVYEQYHHYLGLKKRALAK